MSLKFFWMLVVINLNKCNCDIEDTILDSHLYREPGCPLVAERRNFNSTKVNGTWYLVYASTSFMADLGHALYRRHATLKEIESLCPTAEFKFRTPTALDNSTWRIDWNLANKNQSMDIQCWPQRQIYKTKFECFCPIENFHSYVMIAATDHSSWLLYIRCRIGLDPKIPGEGMSWSLFSRKATLHPHVAGIVFGFLEGFGFNIWAHKFQYHHEQWCQ